MELDPKVAEKILAADFTNIMKKVKSGKPLTASERAIVQSAKSEAGEVVGAYATSLVELAEALGVTRQALDAWRKLPGAPKADAAGRHNTAAWLRFRDERGLKGSETSSEMAEKARAARLRNEDLELDIAIKRGEWTENVVLVEEFGRLAADQKKLLRQKLEKEWPGKLAKCDVATAREEGRKLVDELCRRNQELIDRYLEKAKGEE